MIGSGETSHLRLLPDSETFESCLGGLDLVGAQALSSACLGRAPSAPPVSFLRCQRGCGRGGGHAVRG
eukprot:655545-Rhodomonas_salina.3